MIEWFEALIFAFVIIETIQVFFLLRNNRQLKSMIEQIIYNPEYAAAVGNNLLFGVLESMRTEGKKGPELQEAQHKQTLFFGFVNACGQAAMGKMNEALPELMKDKTVRKAAGLLEVGIRAFEAYTGMKTGISGEQVAKVLPVPKAATQPRSQGGKFQQKRKPPDSPDYGLAGK